MWAPVSLASSAKWKKDKWQFSPQLINSKQTGSKNKKKRKNLLIHEWQRKLVCSPMIPASQWRSTTLPTFPETQMTAGWSQWPSILVSGTVCTLMPHHPIRWRSLSYGACPLLCSPSIPRYQQRFSVVPLPLLAFMDLGALFLWHHSQSVIGHQMAALIGFWPKLCGLNHWLSAALDTDPVHLRCPAKTHTHTHTQYNHTDILRAHISWCGELQVCKEERTEQIWHSIKHSYS